MKTSEPLYVFLVLFVKVASVVYALLMGHAIKKTASISLVPNSVTTIFGFSPTGRHETIRITDGDSELIYNSISYKCQIYALIV